MNQRRTTGIVLTRVNYGEADRILTVLTPDLGKLSLIAKGVRKAKSKLAGGVELFSISELLYIQGRGSLSSLMSARLVTHYGNIVKDIDRTMLGYELLRMLHAVTEDETEPAYYHLICEALSVLDTETVSVDFTRAWFGAQLLRLSGHTPNLTTLAAGNALRPEDRYEFDYDATAFRARPEGNFGTNEIKFLRLLFGNRPPVKIAEIRDSEKYIQMLGPLVVTLRQLHLRV